MPNAIIVVGTNIIIGSFHLQHRPFREVADEVAVNGTPEDNMGDEEEDAVGNNRFPKEYQYIPL